MTTNSSVPIIEKSQFTRAGVGCGAALLTAIPLSLGITVFDDAVSKVTEINGNNGKGSLLRELATGTKKLKYPFRTFLTTANQAVFSVYAPTYIMRSVTESVCMHYNIDKKIPLAIFPFLINCPLSIRKDKILACQYLKTKKVSFSVMTTALLVSRDFLVGYISFVGPEYLTPLWTEKYGWSEKTASTITTVVCPGLAQIPATICHLCGLDMFYRPHVSFAENLKLAFRSARGMIATRMLRQMYAYGAGTVLYRELNAYFESLMQ